MRDQQCKMTSVYFHGCQQNVSSSKSKLVPKLVLADDLFGTVL